MTTMETTCFAAHAPHHLPMTTAIGNGDGVGGAW
jgi:hypothetical protein